MGVIVKEDLCEKVVEVRMVSDGVMTVVVVFEKDVLRLTCGYAPQSGDILKKQSFYDELKGEWDMYSADNSVMWLGDVSGIMGRHIDGFEGMV